MCVICLCQDFYKILLIFYLLMFLNSLQFFFFFLKIQFHITNLLLSEVSSIHKVNIVKISNI
jgi:hypothetical protein